MEATNKVAEYAKYRRPMFIFHFKFYKMSHFKFYDANQFRFSRLNLQLYPQRHAGTAAATH